MKVFVLLAIVAAATAAPALVINSAPFAYNHAIPSTFYSSTYSHAGLPTTYVSGTGAVPTTYLAGSHFPLTYNSPLTYSATHPWVFTSAVAPKAAEPKVE